MKVYIGPYPDSDEEHEVSVEIHPYDSWSADHTLAHIILPLLKEVAKCKHGAPMVDMSDVPSELRVNCPEDPAFWGASEDLDPKFFERWDYVIGEMIWAFEQKNIDWETQYYGEWVKNDSELGGRFINADEEGRRAHQDRMTNGFRLFGKYYESLWT